MVLESIINPFTAEREPWEMFFIGVIYSSIAVIISLWVFSQHASLVMVFLTVMACIPIMYTTIKIEEKKDLNIDREVTLLKEHSRALSFFIYLFLGLTVSFALWYIFVPQNTVNLLFNIQSQTIADINNRVTGNVAGTTGLFGRILLNNIKVMVFCVLFAFLYGAGAIFILTWNASVIGVAIGNFVRSNVSTALSYFHMTSLGLLRYMIHGIPEIFAYFVAGLAGGIISIAIIRHDFSSKKFEHILLDASDLIIIAVFLLLIAALIESYITPLLF